MCPGLPGWPEASFPIHGDVAELESHVLGGAGWALLAVPLRQQTMPGRGRVGGRARLRDPRASGQDVAEAAVPHGKSLMPLGLSFPFCKMG